MTYNFMKKKNKAEVLQILPHHNFEIRTIFDIQIYKSHPLMVPNDTVKSLGVIFGDCDRLNLEKDVNRVGYLFT